MRLDPQHTDAIFGSKLTSGMQVSLFQSFQGYYLNNLWFITHSFWEAKNSAFQSFKCYFYNSFLLLYFSKPRVISNCMACVDASSWAITTVAPWPWATNGGDVSIDTKLKINYNFQIDHNILINKKFENLRMFPPSFGKSVNCTLNPCREARYCSCGSAVWPGAGVEIIGVAEFKGNADGTINGAAAATAWGTSGLTSDRVSLVPSSPAPSS